MPWWASVILILASLAAAGFALRLWVGAWAGLRSASRRICPNCDHDLRATSGATCPECGVITRLAFEDDAILEPLAPFVIDAAMALDPELAALEPVQAIVQRARMLIDIAGVPVVQESE